MCSDHMLPFTLPFVKLCTLCDVTHRHVALFLMLLVLLLLLRLMLMT